MNRVIIESPYAGDIEGNTTYARLCLRHALDQGEAPYASHLLYTQPGVLDDSVPRERERGIQAGYEWMHAADTIAFYVDRGWSPGMVKALKMARLIQNHRSGWLQLVARSIHQRGNLDEFEPIPDPS